MLTFLLIAIAVAVLLQTDKHHLFIGAVFVLLVLWHDTVFLLFERDIYNMVPHAVGGLVYYGSAAVIDLLILTIIAATGNTSKTAQHLKTICFWFAIANFYGWIAWFTYNTPTLYNYSCYVLYVLTFAVFIKRSRARGWCRDFKHSWVSGVFHIHISALLVHFNRNQEKS